MFIDLLRRKFVSLQLQAYIAGGAVVFLLVVVPLLTSCATPSPLDFVPIDLGIPTQAIKSPVVGSLPDSTKLHVAITFKVNQSTINTLDGQRIHPGQHSKLEQFANKIGIDDATYQKIKNFFNLKGIALNLSKCTASPQLFYVVAQNTNRMQPYYDVTRGNNLYYPATPGWDYTSGLGTPNLWDFIMVLCDNLMTNKASKQEVIVPYLLRSLMLKWSMKY